MRISIIKIKDDDTYENIFIGPASIGLFKTMCKVFKCSAEKGNMVMFLENNEIVNIMSIEEFMEL